tara:strand:+ start:149 stop:973 length:825 start_codon:yes stop_codon:yes gene_type:complete
METTSQLTKNVIFIDGSYFVFFRYYALIAWWKLAKKDILLPEKPFESEEFTTAFKRLFIKKVKEIQTKLKIKNPIIIVGKDCPRAHIWRNEFIDNYKGTRDYTNFHGQPGFVLAYEHLFKDAGVNYVISHPTLEADDCIAIATKHLKNTIDNVKITIITADHDYMQLIEEGTEIYTLKYKPIRTKKNSTYNSECDLFCKIITGDKSDNICGVFKKCGKVTALKLWNDDNSLQKKLEKDNCKKLLERNKKLIDFNEIPENLTNEFLKKFIEKVVL